MFRVLARSNQARSPSAKQQFRPRIEWYEEMPVPATGTSSSSQQNLSDCKCPKTIAKGSLAYLLTHLISMPYIQIQRFRNCVVSVIWHLLMSREQHYFLIIIFLNFGDGYGTVFDNFFLLISDIERLRIFQDFQLVLPKYSHFYHIFSVYTVFVAIFSYLRQCISVLQT